MRPYYSLFVSDLDGTLLTDKDQITTETKQALAHYKNAGGKFTIATGRGFTECESYLRELQIDLPIIISNGSLLYFPKTKKTQVVNIIASQYVNALLPNLPKIDPTIDVLVFSPTQIYSLRISQRKKQELAQHGIETIPITSKTRLPEEIIKLQLIGPPSAGQALQSLVSKSPFQHACDFVQSHDYYYEILPKGVSKGSGLKHLNEILGISATHTAVIGDQCNDIPMFQHAGLSAAMDNAHPLAKQSATHHVPSNNENGVAYFIENVLLK